jgi:hypothetical protein
MDYQAFVSILLARHRRRSDDVAHVASAERNALRAPVGNATKKFSKRILFVAVLRSYRCDHRGNTIVIVTGVKLKGE